MDEGTGQERISSIGTLLGKVSLGLGKPRAGKEGACFRERDSILGYEGGWKVRMKWSK